MPSPGCPEVLQRFEESHHRLYGFVQGKEPAGRGAGQLCCGRPGILLVWPDGGNLKAYQGTCPHQHVSLQRGEFNGRIITCPVHRWVFDGRTGKGLQPAGCALSEYPLRIEDGVVQVDVSGTSAAEVSADHCP